jgi:hypothetical protein
MTHRWQFSLRTLLVVTTILAVLTAMLANYLNFMIALIMFALWVLDVGSWLSWWFSPLRDFRPQKTFSEMPRESVPKSSKQSVEAHSTRTVRGN